MKTEKIENVFDFLLDIKAVNKPKNIIAVVVCPLGNE